MKFFLLLIFMISFAACTGHHQGGSPGNSSGAGPQPARSGESNSPNIPTEQGGVDVGNMITAVVPRTNASLTFPSSWKAQSENNKLQIQNSSGSLVRAEKGELAGLVSPNALGLQQYLKAKYPDRNYQIVSFNGLEGVRADLVNGAEAKRSDLYLVSELKDLLHIESDLKIADGGIQSGEAILSTVKVEYRGEPVQDTQVRTVTVPTYYDFQTSNMKGAYSFKSDCFPYVDRNCNAVAAVFGNGANDELSIGAAGYDHGRIIELGSETEIPFDSIKIEGKYLIAPQTKISIADIYTAFTPKNPNVEQDRLKLVEGKVYLIRTIRWPDEDMILKMKVEKLDSKKSVTLTYQKLVAVAPAELKKQVDEINRYTVEHEQPISEGEVTLHNRSVWNNYFYASFNFEFSTSGNMFITHNSWDLLFEGSRPDEVGFNVPHSGSGIGAVVDVGDKELRSISLKDFPDPNTYNRQDRGAQVLKGHTYLIYSFDFEEPQDAATYGAVRVLDLDPQLKWVRLQFRRLNVGPAPHFQKWIPLGSPQGWQSVTLEGAWNARTSRFLPFIGKRSDQGEHYYESMDFNSGANGSDPYLQVDSRPYGNERGFYRLNAQQAETLPNADQIEKLKGQLTSEMNLHKGDVYAVLLENFFDKTVMLIKVEDLKPGKSVTLSYKYLLRAKTQYSDDKD